MAESANVTFPDGTSIALPIIVGTEGERGLDISRLRSDTGYLVVDDAYRNTASCESAVTFIDGERGVLRYRGYPIETVASRSDFVETSQLLIWGELPTRESRARFSDLLTANASMPEDFRRHFAGFPVHAHPMSILSAMINALQAYDLPGLVIDDEEEFERVAASLMSKIRTIAAAAYKSSRSEPIIYPRRNVKYTENFLHMMFSMPYNEHCPTPEAIRALDMFLILHADHEQNCSTSTVRMAASGHANLYAAVAAGVCSLWGRLHGGANQAVVEMLTAIRASGMSAEEYIAKVKDKTSGIRLMGFGHGVYRTFDPRAEILKQAADALLDELHVDDPRLDVARELEAVAVSDDYFIGRSLYPNVDFYSGIILTALGIPVDMFTVLFAIGRVPGWIAHWRELWLSNGRIHRPRQIYVGATERKWKLQSDRV
jgi:citrate synthase